MLADHTYNWDDIQVGRFDFNHSQSFFNHKHSKHEKLSEDFPLEGAMDAMNLNETFSNDENKENMENKENNEPAATKPIKTEPTSPKTMNASSRRLANSTTKPSIKPDSNQSNQQILAKVKSPTSPCTSNAKRRPANLLTKFKTPPPPALQDGKKNIKGAAGKTVEPPHAYDFNEIYKKKKEDLLKKVLEEEKKNRIFRSRPVPKSVIMPTKLKQKLTEVNVTIPKTPNVLKNSKRSDEMSRIRHKIEQNLAKNHPVLKSFNRNPVLNEEIKRSVEEKKKREEEERKKRDEELVKEIRKLASFKARPNPFSSNKREQRSSEK